MKFKKFIAAASAVTMLGALTAVPSFAADETGDSAGPTITKTYTARTLLTSSTNSVSNTNKVTIDGIEYNNEVRASSYNPGDNTAVETSDTASVALFNLGSVYKGEKVTVSTTVRATAGDLTAIGLYEADTNIDDYSTVLESTALSPLGTVQKKANAWPFSNYLTASISTFDGCGSSFTTNTSFSISNNKVSYTATIESDGDLYFLASAWDSSITGKNGNRKIQIGEFSIQHEYPTLSAAVTAANDNDNIVISKDENIGGNRLDIDKSLTISGSGTISGNAKGKPSILVKNGKSVTFDGVNVEKNPVDNDTNNIALQIENSNSVLTVNNATVTGDIQQSNGTNTKINLDNVTVNGNISTRKGRDLNAGSTGCGITLNNVSANSVIYNSAVDTYSATDSTIGSVVDSNAPTITAVVDNKDVYTGDDNSKALGFITTVTSDKANTALSKLTWNVGNKTFTHEPEAITLGKNTAVYFGVIIDGYDGDVVPAITANAE